MPKVSSAPPVVPAGHQLPIYHQITPKVEMKRLAGKHHSKTVSLVVELTHPEMKYTALYTVRLWLWDMHWRLLNRSVVGVAGAFDKKGKFQPLHANAFISNETIAVQFEIPRLLWERTQNFLVTGRVKVRSPDERVFEVMIPRSWVRKEAASFPSAGFRRLTRAFQQSGGPCRWRWWVVEQPSYHEDPQTSEWQRGAWSLCMLAELDSRRQTTKRGWSQVLIWHETDNLSDQEHEIRIDPMASYGAQVSTDDRKFRYAYFYLVLMEAFASEGANHRWSATGGKTCGIPHPREISLPPEMSLLALPTTFPLHLHQVPPVDANLGSRVEGFGIFGREAFHYGESGGKPLFPPHQTQETIFRSSFVVIRVSTLTDVRWRVSKPNLRGSRVAVYFDQPFCYTVLSGYHRRRGACFLSLRF